MKGLSSDFKQFLLVKNNLLTSVNNETDNADATDDADNAGNYNRMIGIALHLKRGLENTWRPLPQYMSILTPQVLLLHWRISV